MDQSKSAHPMFLIAAGSVTLASLAAAAHFTGILPGKSDNPAPQNPPAQVAATAPAAPAVTPPVAAPVAPPATAKAPVRETQPAPKEKVVVKPRPQPAAEPVRVASAPPSATNDGGLRRVSNDAGIDVIPARPGGAPSSVSPARVAPPVCRECGTVDSVREVARSGEASGVGAVAGGVLGGVLGHQVGRGSGKDAATILGAIGGAVGGHHIEKNVRSQKQYQVVVRFDDGAQRTFTFDNPQWRPGDRVRLSEGGLTAL